MKSKYFYFVSFHCKVHGGLSMGNSRMVLDKKIDSLKDIREIEKNLKAENDNANVLVLNYQLLRVEEPVCQKI